MLRCQTMAAVRAHAACISCHVLRGNAWWCRAEEPSVDAVSTPRTVSSTLPQVSVNTTGIGACRSVHKCCAVCSMVCCGLSRRLLCTHSVFRRLDKMLGGLHVLPRMHAVNENLYTGLPGAQDPHRCDTGELVQLTCGHARTLELL